MRELLAIPLALMICPPAGWAEDDAIVRGIYQLRVDVKEATGNGGALVTTRAAWSRCDQRNHPSRLRGGTDLRRSD